MTGFVKIGPNRTRTEIHFIAEHYSLTLALPRNAKHMAIYGQVYFHRRPFAIPIRLPRCTTGSWGPVNGIANDCLDLSCRLSLFLLLTEDTALLSVYLWKVYPAFGYPTSPNTHPLPSAHPL